jgi:hypothetical protein
MDNVEEGLGSKSAMTFASASLAFPSNHQMFLSLNLHLFTISASSLRGHKIIVITLMVVLNKCFRKSGSLLSCSHIAIAIDQVSIYALELQSTKPYLDSIGHVLIQCSILLDVSN